ncbi:hypothetical protein ACHAWF_005186 [Thalassiosira exigua]
MLLARLSRSEDHLVGLADELAREEVDGAIEKGGDAGARPRRRDSAGGVGSWFPFLRRHSDENEERKVQRRQGRRRSTLATAGASNDDADDAGDARAPRRHSALASRSNSLPLDLAIEVPTFVLPRPSSRSSFGGGESSSGGEGESVVSEVTLMTFSQEKAQALRDEFFRRLEASGDRGALTVEEREELFREVRADQEASYEAERIERRRLRKEAEEEAKREEELFNKLAIKRRLKEKEESKRRMSEQEEELWDEDLVTTNDEGRQLEVDGAEATRPGPRRRASLASLESLERKSHELSLEKLHELAQASLGSLEKKSQESFAEARRRSSVESAATAKLRNSCRPNEDVAPPPPTDELQSIDLLNHDRDFLNFVRHHKQAPRTPEPEEEEPKEGDGGGGGGSVARRYAPTSKGGPGSPSEECQGSGESTDQHDRAAVQFDDDDDHRVRIADVVALKLLVAEQQATIDAMSSRLASIERGKRTTSTSSGGGLNASIWSGGLRRHYEALERRNGALAEENEELRRRIREVRVSSAEVDYDVRSSAALSRHTL